MAANQSIAPFPDHIDRDHFGWWLSGLTDGEGCFFLGVYSPRGIQEPRAKFAIGLRQDDEPILRQIQSYFGCGSIYAGNYKRRTTNAKPDYSFRLVRIVDCLQAVRFFDGHPLRSKKANDFIIWKQAVHLMDRVSCRRRSGARKWTYSDLDQFCHLHAELRRIRKFTLSPVVIAAHSPTPSQEIQLPFHW